MAQTAVELLEKELADNLKVIILNNDYTLMEKIFAKAKEMEKAQIITAMIYTFNQENTLPYGMEYLSKRDEMLENCENYYNKTYINGL